MTFGEAMRAHRIAASVSLYHLAKVLDITPAYLSDIERGQRLPPATVERLDRWCDALIVPEIERWGLYLTALLEREPGYVDVIGGMVGGLKLMIDAARDGDA